MVNFSCLLIGENSLLIQCAEILTNAGGNIAAIATESRTVKSWAVERSIPLIDSGGDMTSSLLAFDYDWLFSIANLRMIPESLFGRARCGAVNFHDGPLPELAGLNTPTWSLIEGRATHGVTWHDITAGVDQGDILARQDFDVSPDETALTLNTKCFEAGIESFTALLRAISTQSIQRRRQSFSSRRYFARNKRPEAAATLQFDQPAETLARLVRALSFGAGYANPLAMPKILTANGPFSVSSLTVSEERGSSIPGEVLAIRGAGALIATLDAPVLVEASAQAIHGSVALGSTLRVGDRLPLLGADDRAALDAAVSRVVPQEPHFRRRLATCEDIGLERVTPANASDAAPRYVALPLDLPQEIDPAMNAGLVLVYLARIAPKAVFDIAFSTDELTRLCDQHPGYFAASVPLRMDTRNPVGAGAVLDDAADRIADARRRLTYPLDIFERVPGLERPRLSVGLRLGGEALPIEGCGLTFVLSDDGSNLFYDATCVDESRAQEIAERLKILVAAFDRDASFAALPVMKDGDRQQLLYEANRTDRDYDRAACIHHLIEKQVEMSPDVVAVACNGVSITYRELEDRARSLASRLIADGAGPDVIVGLCLPRSVDMVVGAYAILKAGAAYLPLDPAFPGSRLDLMVSDSGTNLIVTNRRLAVNLARTGTKIVAIEDVATMREATKTPDVAPDNLAYVIYTSGSTGRPKGVMIEHRNVMNFFAGMDDRIPRSKDRQDVWLAVTSLSFDISVLEIFWTLARGFKVVIHASELDRAKAAGNRPTKLTTSMDFSLFYWGNDDGAGAGKYKTLLEGARFADNNGFQAVWTPERHFHAFGGPYPNPAVTGAAVAAVTKNLAVRAGSCVLPLHHPARVAEEWAVVDNLSNGRVGLAFASGWMPEDFVLRPENAPPHNKAALLRDIETVRRLWRGEPVEFDLGSGKIPVVTQPRPVSRELPVWVTTAGNPDTYRDAARLGANVLTHLLGQSISELADKIRIYRETLMETGRDPADFKVTVMLHTMIGADREVVRNLARGPMKDYLKSAAALIKQYAWAFPAFKKPAGVSNPMEVDLQGLEPDELEAILEFAYTRYFEDSGLFGTVEDAMNRLEQLASIGVDEIACLIDFGLPSDRVLEALSPLAKVVSLSRGSAETAEPPVMTGSLAADIRREGATHLQCTPSMASMFLSDPDDRRAIADLKHVFVGGEPLRRSLVNEFNLVGPATIENMYGPTETTIWSSTMPATTRDDVVPIGTPIANTQFYVLDRLLQPVPIGSPGELFIGGDGVARGYLNREELTNERFLSNPFAPGRIYRTGDLVRRHEGGKIEFLGRVDNQVKMRGNRLELGEIEARIMEFPGVRDTVAMVREDRPGDRRIVAYLQAGSGLSIDNLRQRLAAEMPEYMVPAHFVILDAFPLTPNAKVDRGKLPKPMDVELANATESGIGEQPGLGGVEDVVAAVFRTTLGLAQVRRSDNFFALGGHSLLAVQMHRELKKTIAPALTITDLFRFPTVAGLAQHIAGKVDTVGQLDKVAERAASRRAAMENRRAAFVRAPNAN